MGKKYRNPPLQQLEQLYIFRGQTEVVQFLEAHPFLVPLLLEAYGKIKTYFSDAQLFLKVVADPEAIDDNLETLDDHKELVIFIATDLDPDKAIDRLNQLDENWWLDVSDQAEGKLNIHLEFR